MISRSGQGMKGFDMLVCVSILVTRIRKAVKYIAGDSGLSLSIV
jgi:hypothetical protein